MSLIISTVTETANGRKIMTDPNYVPVGTEQLGDTVTHKGTDYEVLELKASVLRVTTKKKKK